MKYLMAMAAMMVVMGLAGFTQAADAAKAKSHTHKGLFVKADATELTYKGVKAPNKEHTIKVDDKTKVTLEGKDAKLADLKADNYLVIVDEGGLATSIEASLMAPPPKAK